MQPPHPPADASDLFLDSTVPPENRFAALQHALGDPRRFRVGEITVELEFPKDAPTLQEVFTAFLLRKTSGL